jgi:hypothetical protein
LINPSTRRRRSDVLFTILAAVAEFDVDLTHAGLEAARARGRATEVVDSAAAANGVHAS